MFHERVQASRQQWFRIRLHCRSIVHRTEMIERSFSNLVFHSSNKYKLFVVLSERIKNLKSITYLPKELYQLTQLTILSQSMCLIIQLKQFPHHFPLLKLLFISANKIENSNGISTLGCNSTEAIIKSKQFQRNSVEFRDRMFLTFPKYTM